MTNFSGGPASGRSLMLKRAPFFLRVTLDARGFDALDQMHDEPTASEELFAYVIDGRPSMVHIHARGNRGGFYTMANYRFIDPQPSQYEMREAAQWAAWCHSHAEAFGYAAWRSAAEASL